MLFIFSIFETLFAVNIELPSFKFTLMKKTLLSIFLTISCVFTVITANGQTPNFVLTSAISINGTSYSPTITQGTYYYVSVTLKNNGTSGGYFDLECDFDNSSGGYLTVVQKQCSQYFSSGQTITITFYSNSSMTYSSGSYQVQVIVLYSICNGCGASSCPRIFPSGGYANPRSVTVISSCNPAAPATLSASIGSPANGTQHYINISCSSVSGVDGYSYDYSYNNSTWYLIIQTTSTSINFNASDQPNTAIYFRVRTYCGSTYSTSRYASTFPIYTACDNPATPTVNVFGSSSLSITLNTESPVANPSTTTYAIYCTNGYWVQSNGTLAPGAIYLPKSSWGTKTITGLASSSSYCFYAYAQNAQYDVKGTSSNYACGTTTGGCTNPTATVNNQSGTGSVTMICNSSGGSGGSILYKWYSGTACSGSYIGTGNQYTTSISGYYACKVYINGYELTCYACDNGYAQVNAPAPPVVSGINPSTHNITAGSSISFSGVISNNPTAWSWTFKEGNSSYVTTSTGQYPSVQFNIPGSYKVTLKAYNSSGWSNLYSTVTGFITVSPNNNQCLPPVNNVIQQQNACYYTGEPINVATGSYDYKHTDFTIKAINSDLNFTRYYSTVNASISSSLGYGWTHSFYYYVINQADTLWKVHYGDGHFSYFIPLYNGNGTSFPLYGGTYETLYKDPGNGLYMLTFKTGEIYNFNSSGQLSTIIDLNGNTTTLNYISGNLTSVVAPGGRTLNLTYNSNMIANISDPLGRNVSFNYDGNGNLIQVTDANTGTTEFTYNELHLITQITNTRGNHLVTNTYDGQNRVITQLDALNYTTSLAYNTPGTGDATVTLPDNHTNVVHHDSYFRLTSETDELGNTKLYSYDYNNNRTVVTDENGNATNNTYDTRGNCLNTTKPGNIQTHISYTALNKPDTITDPLNKKNIFTYNSSGNLAQIQAT